MNKASKYIVGAMILFTGSTTALRGDELVVKAPNGESFVMEIAPQDSFESVMSQIDAMLATNESYRSEPIFPDEIGDDRCPCDDIRRDDDRRQEFCVDFTMSGISLINVVDAGATAIPRNYNAPVSPQEKSDIRYIVTTLAKTSLVGLLTKKGELQRVGNRINHVHPLRFLMAIFTDEELKIGIRNIRPRGWVWDDFVKGLTDSLAEENARANLTDAQVQNFAASVGINPAQISPSVQGHRWHEMVDILINIVPRKAGGNRYDM